MVNKKTTIIPYVLLGNGAYDDGWFDHIRAEYNSMLMQKFALELKAIFDNQENSDFSIEIGDFGNGLNCIVLCTSNNKQFTISADMFNYFDAKSNKLIFESLTPLKKDNRLIIDSGNYKECMMLLYGAEKYAVYEAESFDFYFRQKILPSHTHQSICELFGGVYHVDEITKCDVYDFIEPAWANTQTSVLTVYIDKVNNITLAKEVFGIGRRQLDDNYIMSNFELINIIQKYLNHEKFNSYKEKMILNFDKNNINTKRDKTKI